MSETLSIRLRDGEKAELERAAAMAKETVAEYVRKAVRQRAEAAGASPWEQLLGSVDVRVPAPTNANVRRAMSRGRRKA
jgi:hypothetical protein